jgi:hypothetical protein
MLSLFALTISGTQCLDYLFEIGIKMRLAGIPTVLEEEMRFEKNGNVV